MPRSAACPRPSTASPPARWSSGRPRGQGAGRERHRRRRDPDRGGGRGRRPERILVADDGCGMAPDELPLAVERHATSKLADDAAAPDRHPGLSRRGPAVDRLGGRLRLTSRARRQPKAWALTVEGGAVGAAAPAAGAAGRAGRGARPVLRHAGAAEVHEVRARRGHGHRRGDARRRWPARASASPSTSTAGRRCRAEPGRAASPDALLPGSRPVMGREFADNALADRPGARGRAADRLRRPADLQPRQRRPQYLFVNGRPVRDRLLQAPCAPPTPTSWPATATRWRPSTSSSTPELVDVNVHPAKAEVRFRDPGLVRGLIVGGLRHALAGRPPRAAASGAALGGFRAGPARPRRRRRAAPGRRRLPRWAPGLLQAALAVGAPIGPHEPVEPTPPSRAPGLPAGRRPGPGARDLHRRPDPRRRGHRRPARRPRAAGLRADEGRAAPGRRPAPGAAAARGGRARPAEPNAVAGAGRRAGRARPGGRAVRPRRGAGARDAGPAGRDRGARPGARHRRRPGRGPRRLALEAALERVAGRPWPATAASAPGGGSARRR